MLSRTLSLSFSSLSVYLSFSLNLSKSVYLFRCVCFPLSLSPISSSIPPFPFSAHSGEPYNYYMYVAALRETLSYEYCLFIAKGVRVTHGAALYNNCRITTPHCQTYMTIHPHTKS